MRLLIWGVIIMASLFPGHAQAAGTGNSPASAGKLSASITKSLRPFKAQCRVLAANDARKLEDAQFDITFEAAEGFPQVIIPLKEDAPRQFNGISFQAMLVSPKNETLVMGLSFPEARPLGGKYFRLGSERPVEYVHRFEMQTAAVLKARFALKNPKKKYRIILRNLKLMTYENNICQEGVERVINGKKFKLAWADEFEGKTLHKWTDRIRGYGYAGWFHPGDCAYPDGKGHMVLAQCAYPRAKVLELVKTQKEKDALLSREEKRDYIPTVPHIHTRDSFLYGYHEVRFKLPLIPGPGFCFVFIGNAAGEVEIDIIEQSLYSKGKVVDYKASTIHWYSQPFKTAQERAEKSHNYLSYQFQRLENDPEEAKRLVNLGRKGDLSETAAADMVNAIIQNQGKIELSGPLKPYNMIDKSVNGLTRKLHLVADNRRRWDDGQWHTVAMLWTKDSYSFYYDGEFVCKYDQGLRHVPGQAIFGLRVMGGVDAIVESGKGDSVKETPAKVLVDYYRVYKSDDTGDVVIPTGSSIRAFKAQCRVLAANDAGKLEEVRFDAGKLEDMQFEISYEAAEGFPQVIIPLKEDGPREFNGISFEAMLVSPKNETLVMGVSFPEARHLGGKYFRLGSERPVVCVHHFDMQTTAVLKARFALKNPKRGYRVILRNLKLMP